jgi:hypothetical protein
MSTFLSNTILLLILCSLYAVDALYVQDSKKHKQACIATDLIQVTSDPDVQTTIHCDAPTRSCRAKGPVDSPLTCLIACPLSAGCRPMGFNRTEVACACPCQLCADGLVYGVTNDYKKSKPLTFEQYQRCPSFEHSCKDDADQPQPTCCTVQTTSE